MQELKRETTVAHSKIHQKKKRCIKCIRERLLFIPFHSMQPQILTSTQKHTLICFYYEKKFGDDLIFSHQVEKEIITY